MAENAIIFSSQRRSRGLEAVPGLSLNRNRTLPCNCPLWQGWWHAPLSWFTLNQPSSWPVPAHNSVDSTNTHLLYLLVEMESKRSFISTPRVRIRCPSKPRQFLQQGWWVWLLLFIKCIKCNLVPPSTILQRSFPVFIIEENRYFKHGAANELPYLYCNASWDIHHFELTPLHVKRERWGWDTNMTFLLSSRAPGLTGDPPVTHHPLPPQKSSHTAQGSMSRGAEAPHATSFGTLLLHPHICNNHLPAAQRNGY